MSPVERARAAAPSDRPRVLFIGFSDQRGGAAIASGRLINQLVKEEKIAALELVNLQLVDAPWTLSLERAFRFKPWRLARKAIGGINVAKSDPYGWLPLEANYLRRLVDIWQPDVIHMHNLHGGRGTIPLSILPEIGEKVPIVWTLHDMWAATGHCAYSMGCNRWDKGCGNCPDLNLYPHILRDRTAQIVDEKKPLLSDANPVLVSPSRWLRDVVQQAPATKALDARVIANGIDLSLFNPKHRNAKRAELKIAANSPTLMFAAETLSGDNRKGAVELHEALRHLTGTYDGPPIEVILMGGAGDELLNGLPNLNVHDMGFISDQLEAAQIYAAADLFVCPSLQDNLPNTLLEASGCSTASIVFDGSGSLETIEDGVTGAVVPLGDASAFGQKIATLIADPARLRAMGEAARSRAESHYSAARMASDYFDLYQELIDKSSVS